MKKIILSAAVAAMAFSTSAMAADKGIDINVGGQAVVYYETHDDNGVADTSLFDKDSSAANVGIQLDLGADLGNNFTFGSQLTYLGTAGLEKNLVSGIKQSGGTIIDGSTTDELALTKIFIAKKISNTTIKIGRQELPKSLSPLAFSEGWNVFKNTFDAILVINSDIPKTTLVGAYVSGGTGMELSATEDLPGVAGDTYMITAQTKAIPMTTLTGTYYSLKHVLGDHVDGDALGGHGGINVDAYWIDAKVNPMDMLSVGLQYGNLDGDTLEDTTAWGAKVTLKPVDGLTLCAAYTDVDDGQLSVSNTGTGIKTPLFTQMVYNQNAIKQDSNTWMAKAAYNTGGYGTIIAQYSDSSTGDMNSMGNGADYSELDVIYKIKAGGVQYFAAYIMRDTDEDTMNINVSGATSSDDRIRVWARYAF